MAMNLERDGDGFRWKLDWESVEEIATGHDALVVRDYDAALDAFRAATTRAQSISH